MTSKMLSKVATLSVYVSSQELDQVPVLIGILLHADARFIHSVKCRHVA